MNIMYISIKWGRTFGEREGSEVGVYMLIFMIYMIYVYFYI